MMSDLAWSSLAARLCDSLGVRHGVRVSLSANSEEALGAAMELARIATDAGARVAIEYLPDELDEALLQSVSPAELREPSQVSSFALRWADVHVAFRSLHPPHPSNNPDRPRSVAALRAARGEISALRWAETQWAIVNVPSRHLLETSGAEPETLWREFFEATQYPSPEEAVFGRAMADMITAAQGIRIVGDDTDLSFSIDGRQGVFFDGTRNIPDGEVATAPVDDSAHGYITFPGVTAFAGCVFEDLRLDFERGQVVGVDATRGREEACVLIDTDAGASRIGEFGIGLNPHWQTWTGDLLLDEKILGSIHIALGRAYPECGGVNQSALHWDIVKDLRPAPGRPAGTLLIDGRRVLQNGAIAWKEILGDTC